MASYSFWQFFHLHKSHENAIGKRNVQLWHCKANRKIWPTEFRKPAALKLKSGESRKMQHENVTAVVWQDKRVVLLSTNSDSRTDGTVTRKTGKGNEEIEIACPQAFRNNTGLMGVVDVSDQKSEYYGVGRSSKKWWKFLFHFVLNVCLVNCFILNNLTNIPSTAHGNRQVNFRWHLVSQLIGTFTSRKRTGWKRSLHIRTASPHLFYNLQKISGRVKECALRIEKKKKLHQEGVNKQNINVSSVILHRAMWGVFWNITSSEMWRCKIRWVGYYMHTFITNKLKNDLSFCLF